MITGEAVGMSGKAMFGFELVFYEPVQSDVSLTASLVK